MSDKLLSAIETLYDCVGDNYDRLRALKTYSQIADDSPVFMADMNALLGGYPTRFDCYNISEDVRTAFSTRMNCPVRSRFIEVLRKSPVGTPVFRQSVISDEDWYSSQMYEISSQPFGIYHEATSMIVSRMISKTVCSFGRYKDQAPLDAQELGMIAVLNSHFSRSLGLQGRIDQLEEAIIKSNNVLDLIEFGLVLYNTNQSPVFVNAAAQRIFDANDGLRLRPHDIEVNSNIAQKSFQALIDRIYASHLSLSQRSGGLVSIPRLSRSRPYSLMVVPIHSKKLNLETVTAGVFLFDPDVRKTTAIQMFVSSYDLTRSEAELAHALALGTSLEDAAEKRGVSRNTAKTQLHSIFSKTDTNRQSELVSLLLRSVVGIGLKTE